MAPVQFGVLMIPYQTIDAAMPIDILSSCSKWMISLVLAAGHPLPDSLQSAAIDIEFHHINSTMDPVPLTGGYRVLPSTTIADCPPLDYLLIGGPDTNTFVLSDEFEAFIKKHVEEGRGLFCTCTGALAIASSGVLDGKRATTNHQALEGAMKVRPEVKWEKEQWVVDGNIWTAGGAFAGADMMGHWVLEKFGTEIARFGFQGLDFTPRGLDGKLIVL